MLLTNRLQRLRSLENSTFATSVPSPRPRLFQIAGIQPRTSLSEIGLPLPVDSPWGIAASTERAARMAQEAAQPAPAPQPAEIDPLYLLACHIEWEQREEPGAAWELLAAAESSNGDTRAHARALLAASEHFGGPRISSSVECPKRKRTTKAESKMKVPYGLEMVENCTECPNTNSGFFCGFSPAVLAALDKASHKSVLPAGAILFVEGQSPRGMFILCSGKVNLSTTSREGKILILKTAVPGEPLGLSAAISGLGYETTAETASPCQLNFVDRKNLIELMDSHSEVGMHAARSLSRDYHAAYRDIHDLVLSRSSSGRLARLLLAHMPCDLQEPDIKVHSFMTHEEIAQRIGASRETVTRLLSDLKRRQLIRLDGTSLVIRDRPALEALAV